jgi:hypothetical protein
MRYFLLIAALVAGCGEPSSAPAVPSGGGGPVNVTGTNGSGGTGGGVGDVGGMGGAGGMAVGACDNPSDLEALAAAGSVRDVARDCTVFRCAGTIANGTAYQACVESCIENDVPDLSSECVGCYGAMERCGLDSFCQLRCQSNTCNAMCLSCLRTAGCVEELEACRGIDGSECAE